MDIAIKRVYDEAEESDGFRILVDRLWPRGRSKEKAAVDLWLKAVAPSTGLRKWFDHDAAKWDGFKQRYDEELKANPDGLEELQEAVKGKRKVTLLFGAKDIEHNQAVVLREYLRLRNKGKR